MSEVDIECSKCGFQTSIPEHLVGESDTFDCPGCNVEKVKFYYVIKGKKLKGEKNETSKKH